MQNVRPVITVIVTLARLQEDRVKKRNCILMKSRNIAKGGTAATMLMYIRVGSSNKKNE